MNKLKERILKKANLWHLGAVVLFMIIAMAFFSPALKGYNVSQPDVVNWVGMSQEVKDIRATDGQPGWTNAMFSGMPATQISMVYEGRGFINFMKDAFTLWLPRPISIMFLYFLSFYIMAISFRIKPLAAVIGAIAFGLSSNQIIIIEAGHLTKAFAIGFAPLVIAGLMFAYRWKNWVLGVGLSALFMTMEISANHVQITYYMAFVLLGLGVVEIVRYAMKKKSFVHFGKVTAGVLLAYGVAFLINFGNLSGTTEYAKYSTRGGSNVTINADGSSNDAEVTSGLDREYITDWSYGTGETFTFMVPNFKGGPTQAIASNEDSKELIKDVSAQFKPFIQGQNQYYGDQPFTSGPVYLGIIVFYLAFLAMFYSKEKAKWALLAVTFLTVLLSWGKNFMGLTDFFIDVVPGYNKFRAVTIILAVAQLCVPLLGVMFLNRLFKARKALAANLTGFFIATGLFAFLLIGFAAAPELFNTFLSEAELVNLNSILDPAAFDQYSEAYDELVKVRISVFRSDVLRSLAFFTLGAGLIFLYLKTEVSKLVIAPVLIILVLADMGLVVKRYLGNEMNGRNYEQWTENWKQEVPFTASNIDLQIYNNEVLLNPQIQIAVDSAFKANAEAFKDIEPGEKKRRQDWIKFRMLNRLTNYRVFDTNNAFNSSKASYFHKSIGGYHGAKLSRYQELIEFQISKMNASVVNMLNTKYQMNYYRDQSGATQTSLALNPDAMGNAWFAKDIQYVTSNDEEIQAMTSQAAVELHLQSDNYQVFVNGVPATNEMKIGQSDQVRFIGPVLLPDGKVVMDTADQQLPIGQLGGQELSLIQGEQPGTWTWAYSSMIDTTFTQVLSITESANIGWDPTTTTLVSNDFKDKLSKKSYSGQGTIEMTSYHPDKMIYTSSSSDAQLAVFSELYFPDGWSATVNGNAAEIVRTNYLLRAIELPAGENKIVMTYVNESYAQAGAYAHIGTAIIILLLAGGVFFETKRKDEEDEEEEEDEDLIPENIEISEL
jgi:hypothetical protein